MKQNKSVLAIVAFVGVLVCFIAYRFTKQYGFLVGAVALLMVGVSLTPRNPKKKR